MTFDPHDYVLEKLTQALYDLVTGEGDARSRLDTAYSRFSHLRQGDFPDQLRKNRAEIDRLLTRLPGRTGYIIPDNIRKMKNSTAAKIAELMLEMYLDLKDLQARKKTSAS